MQDKKLFPRIFSSLFACLLLLSAQAAPAVQDNLSFVDLHGNKVNLADYRGKWVVVNYWATWCPPCRAEIPELVLFHEAHSKKDAVVLGFNMEETSRAALSRFVEDYMMTYPIIPMREDTAMIGNVPGLPTTYMINPSGKIVAMKVGEVSMDMLESFIAKNK